MKSMLRRLAIAVVALTMVFGSAQATVGAKVTRDDLPVFDVPFVYAGDVRGLSQQRRDVWACMEVRGRVGRRSRATARSVIRGRTSLPRISSSSSSSDNEYATRVSRLRHAQRDRVRTAFDFLAARSSTLPWGTRGVRHRHQRQLLPRGKRLGHCAAAISPRAYLSRTQPDLHHGLRHAGGGGVRPALRFFQPARVHVAAGHGGARHRRERRVLPGAQRRRHELAAIFTAAT